MRCLQRASVFSAEFPERDARNGYRGGRSDVQEKTADLPESEYRTLRGPL
jgi:hypothetical protein